MTTKQFINTLAKNSGLTTNEANLLMGKFADFLIDSLRQGDIVSLQGFGNFEVKTKAEKKMYNPSKKEYLIVPESKSMTLKVSGVLKEKLNSNN